MDNSLLKYSAKDYFFKACVCHMCVDFVNAQLSIQKYEDMFPAFSETRECKLIKVSKGNSHTQQCFFFLFFFLHVTFSPEILNCLIVLLHTISLFGHLERFL